MATSTVVPADQIEERVEVITEATQEQWDEIEQLRLRWLNEEQIAQYPISDIVQTARSFLEVDVPVWVVDSPLVAKCIECLSANLDNLRATLRDNLADNLRANLYDNLYANLAANLANLRFYCGLWWNVRCAWFQGAEVLGVPRIAETERFINWSRYCPVWMWSRTQVFILRRPRSIHWRTDGFPGLHNESGPAVHYGPLFNLWAINGVAVNEQIVMHPESQTIEEITGEESEEVKRIRIERFGWDRFLTAIGAEQIDFRRNDIEATTEQLLRCDGMTLLRTFCPSTGKVFALEVDSSCETCSQAQSYLWDVDNSDHLITGRT